MEWVGLGIPWVPNLTRVNYVQKVTRVGWAATQNEEGQRIGRFGDKCAWLPLPLCFSPVSFTLLLKPLPLHSNFISKHIGRIKFPALACNRCTIASNFARYTHFSLRYRCNKFLEPEGGVFNESFRASFATGQKVSAMAVAKAQTLIQENPVIVFRYVFSLYLASWFLFVLILCVLAGFLRWDFVKLCVKFRGSKILV